MKRARVIKLPLPATLVSFWDFFSQLKQGKGRTNKPKFYKNSMVVMNPRKPKFAHMYPRVPEFEFTCE